MCADTESPTMFQLAADLRWALPAIVAAAIVWLPRPRRLGLRWLVAVLLGWGINAAFSDALLDPVGWAEALGDEEAHMRYQPSAFAVQLQFGWLPPAIAASLALLFAAALHWMRVAYLRAAGTR